MATRSRRSASPSRSPPPPVAAAGRGDDLVIALDDVHELAEEQMKVQVSPERLLTRITKLMDPAAAVGEYIGLKMVEPHAAGPLADALKTTFERDPQLYYEDGFQELADRGGGGATAPTRGGGGGEGGDPPALAR